MLDNGIRAVFDSLTWDIDGFAVAAGYDETTGKYLGLAIPAENPVPPVSDTTLLVHPDRASAQREAERAEQEAARAAAAAAAGAAVGGAGGSTGTPGSTGTGGLVPGGSMPGPVTVPGGSAPPGTTPPAPPAPKNTRFYGTIRLDPERYVRDFARLYQEIIRHLAAPEGVDLEITIEIEASKKDGYPDDKARIVSENARTLKFDQYGFEDH